MEDDDDYKEFKSRRRLVTVAVPINKNIKKENNQKKINSPNKKDPAPNSFQAKLEMFNQKATEDKKPIQKKIQKVDKSKKITNKLNDMKKEKKEIDDERKKNTEEQDSMRISAKINEKKFQSNEIKKVENKKNEENKVNPQNKNIEEIKNNTQNKKKEDIKNNTKNKKIDEIKINKQNKKNDEIKNNPPKMKNEEIKNISQNKKKEEIKNNTKNKKKEEIKNITQNNKNEEIKNKIQIKNNPDSNSFQNKIEILNNPKPQEKNQKIEKKTSNITDILEKMRKDQEEADKLRKKKVEKQDSMGMIERMNEIQPIKNNTLNENKNNQQNEKEKNEKEKSINIINLSIKDKTKNFLENVKEASEIHKNKVKNINENDFGKDLELAKRLKFEDKMHRLNRKINNCEIKEKIKIILTLKNAEIKCKYETIIYDDKHKKLAESEKKVDKDEIILLDNININFQFTKVQSLTIILKKHISESKKYQTEKIIPLRKLFSMNGNERYEEKIDDLYGNEVINLDYDSAEEENKEKYIQLLFDMNLDESNENDNKNYKINYSIQKKDKIIFKSYFDNIANINKSDKLPLILLEPEFEILFYSKDKKNNKNIKIKSDEVKNDASDNIDLSNIENNLNIKMISKEFEKNKFIKLIKKGLNIDLSIAIDFTCSNGDPDNDESLHKIRDGYINHYEKAIREIYKIISLYNKKDKYDVYGFCANINDKFEKCFNINGTDDPSIIGIENIISEYKKSVMNVEFLAPTYFAPVINTIIKKMKDNKNEDFNYHILLIISDGNIYDIVETIDSIIESSELPLSFIIIGVGDDYSSDMRELNGEYGKLISSNGEILNKDIIQYVHYNDYIEYINKLSEDALRYIPDQITNYYIDKLKE